MKITILLLFIGVCYVSAQRITTIQLDGVQYFISRMNPYSPELNYFLAYQYCRSLGLQLVSFETKEKADTMMQYLRNAGYTKYDFWTSGNNLGTDMFLWMSTGLPFNATFDYMIKSMDNKAGDAPPGTEPQRVARESTDNGSTEGCVAMTSPSLTWNALDCMLVKDFICEQTRCYYYNYGSIPVSATQGNRRPYINSPTTTTVPSTATSPIPRKTTTTSPLSDFDETDRSAKNTNAVNDDELMIKKSLNEDHSVRIDKDAMLKRLVTSNLESSSRPDHLPAITSLFTDSPVHKDNVFEGLETHEIRSIVRSSTPVRQDQQQQQHSDHEEETETSNVEFHTMGPYERDSNDHDYQADQSEPIREQQNQQQQSQKNADDDSSTILPEHDAFYRYNLKVRSNGKVLDPPST